MHSLPYVAGRHALADMGERRDHECRHGARRDGDGVRVPAARCTAGEAFRDHCAQNTFRFAGKFDCQYFRMLVST